MAKYVITGATGQVGKPVALALAKDNAVTAIARFSNPQQKADLEAGGVKCVTVDFASGDFSAVAPDTDYVCHFAVAKTKSFDDDFAANVEGLGFMMAHFAGAKAFLHCSSTAVYQANGHHAFKEDDELGDNHRVPGMSFMPTYSINKIAAETMARFSARKHNLPTTIARLNVPYGDNGGWPWMHLEQVLAGQAIAVHPDAPSSYNPIHEDDIVATVPKLLGVASVPATIVNWGGNDVVSIEEWSQFFAELAGKKAEFIHTDQVLESVTVDLTKMHSLVGTCAVDWRDGMRRLAYKFHPELKK